MVSGTGLSTFKVVSEEGRRLEVCWSCFMAAAVTVNSFTSLSAK